MQLDLGDLGGHRNAGGYRYVLILTDLHSKFIWIRPLKNKEASTVARHVRSSSRRLLLCRALCSAPSPC